MATPIGTLGTIDTLTVGGRVLTDLTNLKTLVAQAGGSANTQNCTFRQIGTSAGYQVPGGKTFNVVALRIYTINDLGIAGASTVDLYYSTTDVGYGTNTATTTTGIAGAGVSTRFPIKSAQGDTVEFCLNWSIPTGFYLTCVGQYNVAGQEAMLYIYGYEV